MIATLAVGVGSCRKAPPPGASPALTDGAAPPVASPPAVRDPGPPCQTWLSTPLPAAGRAQVQRSLHHCAVTTHLEPGWTFALQLRLLIDPDGSVRAARPFDPGVPIQPPAYAACIAAEAKHWKIAMRRKECIEIGPAFEVLSPNVLRPDWHHKDDLPDDVTKPGWWGVCKTSAGAQLQPVQISLRAGKFCGERGGRFVRAAGCSEAVFMVRQIAGLARRALPVATIETQTDGGTDTTFLTLGQRPYQLENVGEQLFLTLDGKRQWLMPTSRVAVDWAGDLDGDGGLDILFDDLEDRGSVLFLSSAALPGEFLHAVADAPVSDC
jgi:hypothetical protein